MVTGFKYLLLIAAGFYLLALLIPPGRQFMKQAQRGGVGSEKAASG